MPSLFLGGDTFFIHKHFYRFLWRRPRFLNKHSTISASFLGQHITNLHPGSLDEICILAHHIILLVSEVAQSSLRVVVVNLLGFDIVVSEFEL